MTSPISLLYVYALFFICTGSTTVNSLGWFTQISFILFRQFILGRIYNLELKPKYAPFSDTFVQFVKCKRLFIYKYLYLNNFNFFRTDL